jgi:sulfoxide reductase heme-binding subunit YedZ
MVKVMRCARLVRHLTFASLCAVSVGALYILVPEERLHDAASIATAYASLAFLTVALTLGPFNVLRQRSNPINSYVRRDVGIWAALLGFVHMVLAIGVSMSNSYLDEFVYVVADPLSESIRYTLFTAGSVLGFMVTLILLLLISLSNDVSLRRLGVKRWKWLHRSSYLGFLFIVVHGVAYQILERRNPALVLVFGGLVSVAVLCQVTGYWVRRSDLKHSD